MPQTNISDFKIPEQQANPLIVNEIVKELSIFNQESGGSIVFDTAQIRGMLPKSSQFDELSTTAKRQDINGTATLTDRKLTQSNTGGVKVFRRLDPVLTTYNAIHEGNLTPGDILRIVGRQYARDIIENNISLALDALVTCINKDANKKNTYTGYSPKALYNGFEFFKINKNAWNSTLVHGKLYRELRGAAYDAKQPEVTSLLTNKVNLFGMDRLLIEKEFDQLRIVDNDDSVAGNQGAWWMLFLPVGAVTITLTRPPFFVSSIVDNTDQIGLRYSGEYNLAVHVKQEEFVGTDQNPTSAQIKTADNWASRHKSVENGCGFGTLVSAS